MYRKVWKIGKPHQAHIKKEDTHHIPHGGYFNESCMFSFKKDN
jgi:hypothetical protein